MTRTIKGLCETLCPAKEVELRENGGLVHMLERGERHVLVKAFSRPAAGVAPDPASIRTPATLVTTVHYLLNQVMGSNKISFSGVYSFVQDRLRAVRQDMIMQSLPPSASAPLLEPMVRFYAYSYYRLGGKVTGEFDPVLNHTHLLECIKWLLREYDAGASGSRHEMEALYILLNLGDPVSLARPLSLPSFLRTGVLADALDLSLAWFLGDYCKVCRRLTDLPPLLSALVSAAHLPSVRRFALEVMTSAYSCKNCCYPLSDLKQLLRYDEVSDAAADCAHYGIPLFDDSVNFQKGQFNLQTKMSDSHALSDVDRKLSEISIQDLILTPCSVD